MTWKIAILLLLVIFACIWILWNGATKSNRAVRLYISKLDLAQCRAVNDLAVESFCRRVARATNDHWPMFAIFAGLRNRINKLEGNTVTPQEEAKFAQAFMRDTTGLIKKTQDEETLVKWMSHYQYNPDSAAQNPEAARHLKALEAIHRNPSKIRRRVPPG